ncbi:MAG: YraN family protein [Actinomycetota bacterium]|nr:YraN family protein [Actinomycetota bacterium]
MPRRRPRPHPRQRLGESGEDLAAAYLQAQGYRIIARNWRLVSGELRGELDIVAALDGTLAFVEVKTRRGASYGGPLLAVGRSKQAKVRALATAFLRSSIRGGPSSRPLAPAIRFDVVAVSLLPGEPPRIEHLPGVF